MIVLLLQRCGLGPKDDPLPNCRYRGGWGGPTGDCRREVCNCCECMWCSCVALTLTRTYHPIIAPSRDESPTPREGRPPTGLPPGGAALQQKERVT